MDFIANILLLFGLGAAIAYLFVPSGGSIWVRSTIKTTPLLCFAVASAISTAPLLLTVSLLLSALGDFALSRPGKPAFLSGLSAFAIAHILYATLFLALSVQPLWAAFAMAPVLAFAMLILAVSTEFWLHPFTGSLRWPVRGYVVLIVAMMLASLTLPLEYRIVTLGSALFIFSDLVLSIRKFRLGDAGIWAEPANWVVWVSYVAGQALIFWGIQAA